MSRVLLARTTLRRHHFLDPTMCATSQAVTLMPEHIVGQRIRELKHAFVAAEWFARASAALRSTPLASGRWRHARLNGIFYDP